MERTKAEQRMKTWIKIYSLDLLEPGNRLDPDLDTGCYYLATGVMLLIS